MGIEQIIKEEYLPKVEKFLGENGFKREHKCDDVGKETGNYHIYDMPRRMVICGEDKMNEFIEFLKREGIVASGFKGRVGLTYI